MAGRRARLRFQSMHGEFRFECIFLVPAITSMRNNRINYNICYKRRMDSWMGGMRGQSIVGFRNSHPIPLFLFFGAYNGSIYVPACQHWSLGVLASTHNTPIFRCESRAKCERKILSECERCNSLSLLTVFFLAVVLPTWINEVHQQRRQIKSYPPYSVRITLYFVNSGKKGNQAQKWNERARKW